MKRKIVALAAALGAVALLVAAAASGDSGTPVTLPHHPLFMPMVGRQASSALQPPPVCCVPGVPVAVGTPTPVNMAYFGGHVQTVPKIYVDFWGWGEKGAWTGWTPLHAGGKKGDPDGVAARVVSWVKALGGTGWAGVQTQYYQQNADGSQTFITNPKNQYGGVWYDNVNPSHTNLSYEELAQEAARAAAHFHITDFANANIVVAQPPNFEDGQFQSAGYCAWHDYTQDAYYPGVKQGISFTNLPYILQLGGSCGQDAVNAAPQGDLDGVSIVLGHEIEETVTDPGAEDAINCTEYQTTPVSRTEIGCTQLGGWFDQSGWENGDKCAWVGFTGAAPASTVPGGLNDITGNDGKTYAVQSLWSNNSAEGAGYCAGAGDDLPTG
jgi:serine protease